MNIVDSVNKSLPSLVASLMTAAIGAIIHLEIRAAVLESDNAHLDGHMTRVDDSIDRLNISLNALTVNLAAMNKHSSSQPHRVARLTPPNRDKQVALAHLSIPPS